MTKEFERGFQAGWRAYQAHVDERPVYMGHMKGGDEPKKPRKKARQSGKQKLLTDMASKAWKSYKRKHPKGKRTYIDIRAQVSRSQAYKKKAKRL